MARIKDSETGKFIKSENQAIAKKSFGINLYQKDYDRIKDLPNRSEIIREAVAEYLKRVKRVKS